MTRFTALRDQIRFNLYVIRDIKLEMSEKLSRTMCEDGGAAPGVTSGADSSVRSDGVTHSPPPRVEETTNCFPTSRCAVL